MNPCPYGVDMGVSPNEKPKIGVLFLGCSSWNSLLNRSTQSSSKPDFSRSMLNLRWVYIYILYLFIYLCMNQTGAFREACFVSYVTPWIYVISFCICGFLWSTMESGCFRKVGAHGPSDSWVKSQCCLKKKKYHVCLSENRGYTIRIYEGVLHEYHIQWGYLYWLIFKTLHPCSSGKLGFIPLEYRVFTLQFSDQPMCQKGPQKSRSRL